VFPIAVPPLRERAEDIPLLVGSTSSDASPKPAAKNIRNIGKQTLEQLRAYQWPGNIRELQNVVERAVILTESGTFVVDESWVKLQSAESPRPHEGLSALADRENRNDRSGSRGDPWPHRGTFRRGGETRYPTADTRVEDQAARH